MSEKWPNPSMSTLSEEELFRKRGVLTPATKQARTNGQKQLSSFRITPASDEPDNQPDHQPNELTLHLSLSLRNQLVAGLNRTSEILSGKSVTPVEKMNLFNSNNDLVKRLMELPVYLTSKQSHIDEELDTFLAQNVEQVSKPPEYYHPFGISGQLGSIQTPQRILSDVVRTGKESSTQVQRQFGSVDKPITSSPLQAQSSSRTPTASTSAKDQKDDLAAFLAEPDPICFPYFEIEHRTDQVYALMGKLSWKMKNVSQFFSMKVGCRSPPIHIRDHEGRVFRFKLRLTPIYLKTKGDTPKHVDLYIECDRRSEQWTCHVKGHLRLVNQRELDEMDDDDSSMHRLVPIKYTFDHHRNTAGLPNLISYRLLTKSENGFYLNDSLAFEFEVTIQKSLTK